MRLAFTWMFQAALLFGCALAARSATTRWRSAVARVRMYPGATAVAAWVALQALPVSAAAAFTGVAIAAAGFAALGSLLVTVGVLIGFVATCGAGVLLPNLGVSYSRSPS